MKYIMLILFALVSIPVYSGLGSFVAGVVVGGSGSKTAEVTKSVAVVEAEEFINTFYTHRFYPGHRYTKSIDVLYNDKVKQTALLLASFRFPRFDKDGEFLKHTRETRYILMKTDAEGIYQVHCMTGSRSQAWSCGLTHNFPKDLMEMLKK